MAEKKKSLNDKLAEIQTKFKSKKSRYNSFGKYYFRSAEDILEAVKPFLLDLGVSIRINEEYLGEDTVPVLKSTAILTDGTDQITSVAIVGVDLNQKGMQVPQQFGSASSYGKKYALGNLFLIDDTQDSDATNSHDKKAMTAAQIKQAKAYLKNGGDIAAIEKKYNLTDEIRAKLGV